MKKEKDKMNKFDKAEKNIEKTRKGVEILSLLVAVGSVAYKVLKEVGKAATKL